MVYDKVQLYVKLSYNFGLGKLSNDSTTCCFVSKVINYPSWYIKDVPKVPQTKA